MKDIISKCQLFSLPALDEEVVPFSYLHVAIWKSKPNMLAENAEGLGMSGVGSCWPTKADGTLLFPTLCPVMSHWSPAIGYGWHIYNVEIDVHYK